MKPKICFLMLCFLFASDLLLAQPANGGFETTNGIVSCSSFPSTCNRRIPRATGWDGIQISYTTGNCANPTFTTGCSSGIELFSNGQTNACATGPARTGLRAPHLEFRGFYQNQTASAEWLRQTLSGTFNSSRKYVITAFINTLGSSLIVTPTSNYYAVGFRMVNTSVGTLASDIINNGKAQPAQPVIVTTDAAGWVKMTLIWTPPTTGTYNLLIGPWASDVFCNDGAFSFLCAFNIDDVAINCFADAGLDKQNTCYLCCNPPVTGVQLGTPALSGFTYAWAPSNTLNSATAAQPTASPCGNTTYTLTVTSSAGECAASTDFVFVNTLTNQACCRTTGDKIPFEFTVYPNPSKDGNIFVDIPANYDHLKMVVVNGQNGTVIFAKEYTGLKQSEKVKLLLPAKAMQKEERVLMITEPETGKQFSVKLL
jgi:hypothetical protein